MLKIRIKNCCCCCNSSGGGSSGGNSGDNTGGEGGESTTKHLVTIGHPIDYDTNEPIDSVQNYFIISVKNGDGDFESVNVGDTINVEDGASIVVSVTAEEYDYFEQEYTITEPQTITPVLKLTSTEPTYYTVTVNTTPSSAEVTMNGTAGNVQQFLAGSTINIVASKDGYYDATDTVQKISDNVTVNLRLTPEPDPYAGYRLNPNQSATYNGKYGSYSGSSSIAGYADSIQTEEIESWIQGNENTEAGQLDTAYDIDSSYPIQYASLKALELLEGGEFLDSYELIHFTRFVSENHSGQNTIMSDDSGNEIKTLNLSNTRTVNPECFYRLKFKFKSQLTAGVVKFKVTQNLSNRYIIYTYTINE